MYKAGDTIPALRNFLNEIEKTSKLKINLNAKNVFHSDNESFRYLALLKTGNEIIADENVYENSWQISCKSSMKMLEYIDSLHPLIMNDIVILNETIKLNDELAKKIIEVFKNIISRGDQLVPETSKKNYQFSVFNPLYYGYRTYQSIKKRLNLNNVIDKNRLDEIKDDLIEMCAKLSNMICSNSLALFNDELDAHLEEEINNQINIQIFKPNEKTFEFEFKSLRDKYRILKIENVKDFSNNNKAVLSTRTKLISYINEIKKELLIV